VAARGGDAANADMLHEVDVRRSSERCNVLRQLQLITMLEQTLLVQAAGGQGVAVCIEHRLSPVKDRIPFFVRISEVMRANERYRNATCD
jgi:hypothetical protein